MASVTTFVIHLDRSRDRVGVVDAIRDNSIFPTTVINAVDGQRLASEHVARLAERLVRPYYPFRMLPAEVGCFLSHRLAWAAIASGSTDFGLVFEDDAEIEDPSFWNLVAWASTVATTTDCVRLSHGVEMGKELKRHGEWVISVPEFVGLRATCQLVGRDAAAALLKATAVFDRPVDVVLQMVWEHKVRVLSVSPVLVRPGAMAAMSTIQKRQKSVLSRLHHEIARPIYRQQIRRLSRRHGSRVLG